MIKIAVDNLVKNKVRSILSMLGIIIGVASIIVLVAVVDGMFFEIQAALSEFQGITVIEDGALGPPFSRIDASYENDLKKMPYVKSVVPSGAGLPRTIDGEPVAFELPVIRLIGSDYSKKTFSTAGGIGGELIEGKELDASDRKKVLIGVDLKDKLNKFVGNTINIDGEKFKIIGIYETASSFFNSSILMSLDDLKDLKGISANKVPQFTILLTDVDKTEEVVKLINFKFEGKLKAYSSQSFGESIGGFLDILRLMVVAIALVAAVVAGIGILNTMLMSVLERFQEIGTLKAVGWSGTDVMSLILIESAFLGVIGSLTGVFLALFLGIVVIQGQFGLTVYYNPVVAIGSFLFGITISIIAGVYPAKVASQLNPIEALRIE